MTAPEPAAGSRMELRRRRRTRRRQLLALVLLVLVAVLVAVTVRLAGHAKAPVPAVQPQQRTQRTLLMQVQAPNGEAAATALLAHDPAAHAGAVVLVPPQTLVTVPGTGTLTVGRALRTVASEGTRSAIADGIGVTVDDGWVIDQPTLEHFVNAVGGLQVDVDVPVLRQGKLRLSPGPQRLDGENSLILLSYRAPGEQEQARLARVQTVLDALVSALPDREQTAVILRRIGPRSIASEPLPQLADLLVGLHEDDAATTLQYGTLPVVPIDTGTTDGSTTFRIDAGPTRTLVDRLLAGSIPAGERQEGNRVLVLNGVGTPGLGEKVRDKLVAQGFVFVGSRNAARFGYATTQVLVPEATPQAQQLGTRVAAALGFGPEAVRSSDQLGSVADVVVLVGSDFAP